MLRTADHWATLPRDEAVPVPDLYGTAAPAKRCYDKDQHMKISEMIPSKYLKQSDVDEDTTVTVQGLKRVNVARDDEDPDYRWTIQFMEFEKPMVLNTTNLKRLGKALGDDTENWMGNQVVLYVDPDIEFGGNVVGGLRIRAVKSKRLTDPETVNRKLAAASGADHDDIPF